jgi:flagellin
MTINTNISALTAYRNLSTTQKDMSKSLEKLSSGLRINRAADDAAGLAISQGLKSQVGGLTVAARNAQDGISVAQTAEGSLGQVQSILQRLRDLSVQAGNDSNNVDSRKAITTEATSLTQELGRISTSTNFNGINLLDGTAGTAGKLTFQVGANGSNDNQITIDLSSANVGTVVTAISTNVGTDFAVTPGTVAGAQTFSSKRRRQRAQLGQQVLGPLFGERVGHSRQDHRQGTRRWRCPDNGTGNRCCRRYGQRRWCRGPGLLQCGRRAGVDHAPGRSDHLDLERSGHPRCQPEPP